MTLSNISFLFLRTGIPYTYASLISSESGLLRWWNVFGVGDAASKPEIGRFRATPSEEAVMALTTDSRNSVLITADTRGVIAVWNIENYCGSTFNVSTVGPRYNSPIGT